MAIILASQSPRRRELLQKMGVTDFRTMSLDVDESYPAGLTPEETVAYIAHKKSDAAAALVSPGDLVITADTMVFLDADRLGKPRDEADALRMLTELSGRQHTVCTGVSVRRGEDVEAFTVSTAVYFRACTQEELEETSTLTRPASHSTSTTAKKPSPEAITPPTRTPTRT